jgi:uncharacterized membrane protein YadS
VIRAFSALAQLTAAMSLVCGGSAIIALATLI